MLYASAWHGRLPLVIMAHLAFLAISKGIDHSGKAAFVKSGVQFVGKASFANKAGTHSPRQTRLVGKNSIESAFIGAGSIPSERVGGMNSVLKTGNVRSTVRYGVTGLRAQESNSADRNIGVLDRRRMLASTLALSSSVAASLLGNGKAARADVPGVVWSRPEGGAQQISSTLTKVEKTYPLRFVTYFSRFMLTYDTSSVNWWRDGTETQEILQDPKDLFNRRLEQFGRFAASAEIGLARFPGKDGAQALCELMVNRYGTISREALKQIAFLFTLLEEVQPTELFGEILSKADNATVSNIQLISRGTGYTGAVPEVTIDTQDYLPTQAAEAKVVLRENGKVGRIKIIDGGAGYTKAPKLIFNRTVPLTQEKISQLGLQIEKDQLNTASKAPSYEVVMNNGSVEAVNFKDGGSGWFDGTYEFYFEEPFVPLFDNTTEALESDLNTGDRRRAQGTLTMDKEISEIKVTRPGKGYSPAFPVTVRIQSPSECGGLLRRGEAAVGGVKLAQPQFRSESAPSIGEQDQLKFTTKQDKRLKEIDSEITSLLASSLRLQWDPKGKKLQYVETSALGNNVTTSFGPRSRLPITKDDMIGGDEIIRIGLSGALCASVAHGALVPLDTVKLKLQTAPKGKYKSLPEAVVKVLRDEGGIKTFVNGFQPEFLGSAIYGFFSFGGTEILRRSAPQLLGAVNCLQYSVPILVGSSVLASIVAAVVSCPFQAVKIRMVADENYGPGGNMIGGFKRFIREDGAYGLIQGAGPLLVKDVSFVLSKFSIFDIVSKAIYFNYPDIKADITQTLLVSLVSGVIAGTCAAVTSQPGDYIFSKANEKQGASFITAWNGYWEEKNYGVVLSGLGPRIIYGGTLIALQFVIYDYCRVLFHVSPGELNVFLDVVAGLANSGK